MYAITGITGQVGSGTANQLLKSGQRVRAIVRSADKGEAWRRKGCEVVVADLNDTDSLVSAFEGVMGVFILLPPNFDPSPGFTEAKRFASTVRSALDASKPERAVYLSTVGAQSPKENLLTQHTIVETTLKECSVPVTFLRPAWFMENSAWDVEPAKTTGVISSFLQPLDRKIAMVATADIGKVAAQLLQEPRDRHEVVELEGPERVSPNDVADTFSDVLHKLVHAKIVPRSTWEELFRSQGMKNPTPRIQMLDGFNEGWIDMERPKGIRKGETTLKEVVNFLVQKSA